MSAELRGTRCRVAWGVNRKGPLKLLCALVRDGVVDPIVGATVRMRLVKRHSKLLRNLNHVQHALKIDGSDTPIFVAFAKIDLRHRIENQRVFCETLAGRTYALQVSDIARPARDSLGKSIGVLHVPKKNAKLRTLEHR